MSTPARSPLRCIAVLTGAVTYHLRTDKPLGGFALCTVHDRTGELHILSDWGNWSHSWFPAHLGEPSLHHFIARNVAHEAEYGSSAYDYLACKLLGSRGASVAFDVDATLAEWRHQLAENRLARGRRYQSLAPVLRTDHALSSDVFGRCPLTAVRAREIWDELDAVRSDVGESETLFLERAMNIDGIHYAAGDEPWESTKHVPSREYRVLTETILPALAAACAQALADRTAATYTEEGITAS